MKHINVSLFVPHNGCPHQCSFCNQKTISGHSAQVTAEDVDRAAEIAMNNPDSIGGEIAFFGGSFTAIDESTMISLLKAAYRHIRNNEFKGIRISTRPDAVDERICEILKQYGVTAVEIGAQSMDDTVLELNHRGHTSADVINASKMLKSYGFELGLQMMTGLYGSSKQESVETAKKIIALSPDTVRIYPTVVLDGTELAQLYRNGAYSPQTVDEAAEVCAELLLMFHKNNIKVIRTGLHSGGDVESGYVAGAYHPSFKELCEGKIYYKKAIEFIKNNSIKPGKIEIFVSPQAVSPMVGQKKVNKMKLLSLGYDAKIIADNNIPKYEINILRNEIK